MSKKNYQECEGCRNMFPPKKLEWNDDLDLVCPECMEEGKREKRSWNFLILGIFFIAASVVFVIYKSCSR